MDGYIKIFRQIKDWAHFQEPSVLLVWLWLLVSVNFKDGYFHGKLVKKGEIITSFRKISEETGLSINTIRSCLDKLKMSGEISQKKSENSQISQYTHIVVNQFVKYQSVSMVDTPTDTLVDTLTDTPTDTLVDNNRRKKRNIRKEECNIDDCSCENSQPTDQPQKSPTLEERQKEFYDDIAQYVGKYDKEMLRAFYDYWSEPTQNKKNPKMRKDTEKTWSTAGRLATWYRRQNESQNINNQQLNNKNYGSNQQNYRKEGLSDAEILEAVAGGFALFNASKQSDNQ
ncbi:MAG: hypothetical protein IIW13_02545 [Paludibacteraceae bacterium]|nr:hypothetical protein [Paludibacteraceae bacterium]